MTVVRQVRSLDAFKKDLGISEVKGFTSKKGNKYALAGAEYVGLADDFSPKGDIIIMDMVDEESGESWFFMANGQPREADFTV